MHKLLSVRSGNNITLQNMPEAFQAATLGEGLWLDWVFRLRENESEESSAQKADSIFNYERSVT